MPRPGSQSAQVLRRVAKGGKELIGGAGWL